MPVLFIDFRVQPMRNTRVSLEALGTLLGRKVEVAGYAIGVGLQGGKAVLAFAAPHQRVGE